MAMSQTGNKENQGDLSDIKRKLAWRMGFAALMIVALLGGLALFDYFGARVDPDPGAPQFTEPVPVPKKTVTQPVTPAEPAKEEKSVPEASAAPVLEAPPRPEVSAQPVLPRATQPAGRTVSAVQQAPAVSAKTSEARTVPLATTPVRAEQPVPTAQAQPSPPRLFSGYALQAGVFSDPRRAEELHARLTLEGIPSTIEARVQVGPFKSKEEAEAAREKMKAMGIDAVLLLPKGLRR